VVFPSHFFQVSSASPYFFARAMGMHNNGIPCRSLRIAGGDSPVIGCVADPILQGYEELDLNQ
jgi:hypothetical protein